MRNTSYISKSRYMRMKVQNICSTLFAKLEMHNLIHLEHFLEQQPGINNSHTKKFSKQHHQI